jgi:adenine-specific DNA-methyltransferase
MPMADFVDWCCAWLAGIHRATANDGALLLNVGYVNLPELGRAVPLPYLLWDETPFCLQQEIIGMKRRGRCGWRTVSLSPQ